MKKFVERYATASSEERRLEDTLQSLRARVITLKDSLKSAADISSRTEQNVKMFADGEISQAQLDQFMSEDAIAQDKLKRAKEDLRIFAEQIPKVEREIRNIKLNLDTVRRELWDSIFKALRDKLLKEVGTDLQKLVIASMLRNNGHTIGVFQEAFADLWASPANSSNAPSKERIDDIKGKLLGQFIGEVPVDL